MDKTEKLSADICLKKLKKRGQTISNGVTSRKIRSYVTEILDFEKGSNFYLDGKNKRYIDGICALACNIGKRLGEIDSKNKNSYYHDLTQKTASSHHSDDEAESCLYISGLKEAEIDDNDTFFWTAFKRGYNNGSR